MRVVENSKLPNGVIYLNVDENGQILAIDEVGKYYQYHVDTFPNIQKELDFNIKNRIWSKAVAFSKDGTKLIYGLPNSPNIQIFSLENGEMIFAISKGHHQGEILSVVADFKNRYFLSAGRDGRAFLWNIESGSLVSALPKEETAINVGAFHPKDSLIALGSEGGDILIYNSSTMKKLQTISNEAPIRGLQFLSDRYILSLDKSNIIKLWRFKDGKLIQNICSSSQVLTKFTTLKEDRFLLIGDIRGNIVLYDLIEHETINKNYITLPNSITNIVYLENSDSIFVSDAKGNISQFSTELDRKLLNRYIQNRKYKEAYKLIQSNDLLKWTDEAKILEDIWHQIFKKSKTILDSNEQDSIKVELLLEPFIIVPEKKEQIKQLLEDFKQYKLLKKLIQKGSYYLAYDLVEKYPNLQETKQFKQLESIWNDLFNRARIELLEKHNEIEAKKLLESFEKVPEKAVAIRNLFQQKTICFNFQNMIENREYNKVINFVEQNNFLETNKDYQKMIENLDSLMIDMYTNIRKGNLDKAKERALFLSNIKDFRNEARKALEEIQIHKQFREYIKEKNIGKIFEMAEKYEFLQSYPVIQKLSDRWNDIVFEAQELANRGEIDEVKDILFEFRDVEVKYQQMANIFKLAYLTDLRNTIREHGEYLEYVLDIVKRGIRNYFKMFGEDQEINDLVDEVKRLSGEKIIVPKSEIGDIANWNPDKIKDTILES